MHLWHRVIRRKSKATASKWYRATKRRATDHPSERPTGRTHCSRPVVQRKNLQPGNEADAFVSGAHNLWETSKRRERTQRPSPCTRRRDRKPRWSGVGGGGKDRKYIVYWVMDDGDDGELMIKSERAPTAHLIDTFQRHCTTILWLMVLSLPMLLSSCLGVCVDDRKPCVSRVRVTRYARTAVCRENAYARDNRRP